VRVEQRYTLAKVIAGKARIGKINELKRELLTVLLFRVAQELVQTKESLL